MHLLTYLLFMSLVSLEESLTFSGYSTSPSILLGGMTRRQDAHLASHGRGNFAPWGIMDWLHSTGVSGGGDIGDDVRDELDEHDVGRRAGEAWQGTKAASKDSLAAVGAAASGKREKRAKA